MVTHHVITSSANYETKIAHYLSHCYSIAWGRL